ncbi:acyl transferase domain-containing protein [Novosphingobium sp. PhB165]|uniref:type I polyketide synthase n=1 Tax=Novosphingobium sp. PhB165 TaxID=2485105 RepID=UPI00104D6A78|nr:type I polyketide synthase [Novosphingobium sp. PhB165]TCM20815.1 acyl transferase domain-containing protein [Novosphingobium sp. PhB165]
MHQSFDSFEEGGMETTAPSIAIVGMSCRFAGARGPEEFWSLLREGREGIETFGEAELLAAGVPAALLRNPNYVRRGAPLADMECFDAALFGLSQRDAAIMDPQHRHFLECAWEALEDAGHTPKGFAEAGGSGGGGGVIGVFAGSGHNAYMPYNLLTNGKLVNDVGLFLLRHTSNDKDFLTTRVSYLFDLKGPSINVQTACSTSLVSIHMAMQSLLSGECDMALAGGTSIELPHRQGYLYEEGEILSPDGLCRPFDAASKGTVFGSGVAVLALRRLEDAIESGDHIHAVLRGSAINNDGAGKVGYLAPSVDGQAAVIAEALAVSDVDPAEIDYVEAHGTGTPIGDPIEVAALTQVYGGFSGAEKPCALGSVKANIGHTDTAAGAAGVIKVALAMRHGEIPPVPNFTTSNPDCALDAGPFYIPASSAPWPRRAHRPRRAGVSSLGVGGTNAHVIMEEAPLRAPGSTSRRRQLLLGSGQTAEAASANLKALAAHFAANREGSLADAAFTLVTGRRHLPIRRFAVAGTADEAVVALEAAAADPSARPPCIPGRPVAFLFCGGGPQHVDMARDLYETEPTFRVEIDRGIALANRIGVPELRRWLFPVEADRARAAEEMERPSNALPALFIVQTALARLWMSFGIEPAAMIGHSCGEYAAAHISGVVDLETGLRIVHARGRLFETTGEGAMLGVPLSEAELAAMLPADLSIATINTPRLCVLSGAADAIARFHQTLETREIESQPIPITVAAHSPMLDPILPEFRALLRTMNLRAPTIPFASNLTGDWVRPQDATDPEYWVRHLREPVRFTDGLQRLLDDPERVLLEVGPGRTMGSLARHHPARPATQPVISSMRHPDQPLADDACLMQALGELWAAGVDIDWQAWWGGERRLRVPLPTYRFDRQRHWIEPGASLALGGHGHAEDVRLDLADWTNEPVWTHCDLPDSEPLEGPALVLCDESGFGERLAARLRAREVPVVTVRAGKRCLETAEGSYIVRPGERNDWGWLLGRLADAELLPRQVYHCWQVTAPGSGRSGRERDALLARGLHSLVALAPELADACDGIDVALAVVTSQAQCVGGDSAVMPIKATMIGAARTVAAEYPGLRTRAIDIDYSPVAHPQAIAGLTDWVIAGLGETDARELSVRAGEGWLLDHRMAASAPTAEGHSLLRQGGTYVVTGGLGGIGLTIARHLASRFGARIVLVGRTALPPRARWAELLARGDLPLATEERVRKLLALEAAGAQVESVVADVADARALRRGLRRAVSRFGPITGVFHAAGTLDDGLIETRTRSAVEAVLRPKIDGTLALEEALDGHAPEFLVLFSSISAFAGIPGQIDYAAANAFLDAYAQSRRHDPVTRVCSVGWSQWAEVGMAAALNRPEGAASELPADLGEGKPVAHPFLERIHAISSQEFVVTGTLSPQRHWLLAEHRVVNAGALLPGTGFLELARAAVALVKPGPLEFSDFSFLRPFAVPDDGARELCIHARRRAEGGWRISVLGRPEGAGGKDWVEHARGLVRCHGTTPLNPALDLDAIAERCRAGIGGGADQPKLQVGPRWNNLTRTLVGKGEALLRLELPEEFHGDLDEVLLHPALLDFATAGAQTLIPGRDAERDFYAPFTYRRFLLHAPLPAEIVSHVRLRPGGEDAGQTAVFNVTITDPDGLVLAEASEFTMMRVIDTGLLSRGSESGAAPVSLAPVPGAQEGEAILPEEGVRIVERLLAGKARPHTVISPYPLPGVLARLRKPPRRAPAASEGDPADLPATEAEKVIADLWCDLLGMDAVGRNDNFFDLGGHSLLAVQFTNRLRRKTGQTLPLAAMLGQPTVANLAAIIDPDSRALGGGSGAAAETVEAGVITIRKGGSGLPLFLIHDGLGETLLYRGLALRLDSARPILGLEPLRNADGSYAHTRIDEMAAYYLGLIRQARPTGPYLLAGLCAGGVIAFEIGRQLQDLGEQVAFVGIIDAADVEARRRRFLNTRFRLARMRGLIGEVGTAHVLPELGRRAWNAVRWEVGSRVSRIRDRRTVQSLRAGGVPTAAESTPARAMSFLKLYEVAHKEHQPRGIFEGGMVALFKASDVTNLPDDMPYRLTYRDYALGWGKRVREEIMIVDVPGGHGSSLQEPNIETLAPLFQEALDNALMDLAPSYASEALEGPVELLGVAAE